MRRGFSKLVLASAIAGCSSSPPSSSASASGPQPDASVDAASGSSMVVDAAVSDVALPPAPLPPAPEPVEAGVVCDTSAPIGTGDACIGGAPCSEQCGGGYAYSCFQDGGFTSLAPSGAGACRAIAIRGSDAGVASVCCDAMICARYAPFDPLCSGKKAINCTDGASAPAECTRLGSGATYCCP